jgi:biopolymer transport protein ExbD/biopolymer transport protein TolR
MSAHPGSLSKLRHARRTLTVKPASNQSAEINITPLIDVVLVLLIIFMVMTPLQERDLGVQLSTEKRTEQKSDVAPTQVLVAVDKAGVIKINSELVSRQEYVERLKKLLAGRKPEDQVVFVVASDDTSYAALVEAIDRAKQAGALMVGLATDTNAP